MSVLWQVKDIAEAVQGDVNGVPSAVEHVVIDSRAVKAGDLFVAIHGERQDGHVYVKQALEAGASAALVHYVPEDVPQDAPLIIVDDTSEALVALGKAARARLQGKLVGITGSVGKTTARALTAHALGTYGSVHATEGNLNNHYGVPLTLSRMPESTDYAVIEMGMNHAGEISQLTVQAKPHVAAITHVDAVHLEHFDDVAGIADAKAEIMHGIAKGGVVCLPVDNPYASRLERHAQERGLDVVWFGKDAKAEVQLVAFYPHQCAAEIRVGDVAHPVALPQASLPVAMNSCVALALVHALGLDVEPAVASLATAPLEQGRGGTSMLQFKGRTITLVDDSYNASPASMKASLQTVCEQAGGNRVVAVLGDMLELGERSQEFHEGLKASVEGAALSGLVCVGEYMRYLADARPVDVPVQSVKNVDEVIVALDEWLQDGDILLLKGSHGTGLYQLPNMLKAS